MGNILYPLVAVCFSLICNLAFAETFLGRVIGISDGDTLTILINEHEQIKVRLAEIDAPEKKQPYGQRSKQSLSNMCYQQTAVIERIDIDRYGRTVGKVLCGQVNANAEQIRKGMAWGYRKYLHDDSLLLLEQEAPTGSSQGSRSKFLSSSSPLRNGCSNQATCSTCPQAGPMTAWRTVHA